MSAEVAPLQGALPRVLSLSINAAQSATCPSPASALRDDLLNWMDSLEKALLRTTDSGAEVDQALQKLAKSKAQFQSTDAFSVFLTAGAIKEKTGALILDATRALRGCQSTSGSWEQEVLSLRHTLQEEIWPKLEAAEDVLDDQAAALQSGELSGDAVKPAMHELLEQIGVSLGDGRREELESLKFAVKKASWQAKADRDSPKSNHRHNARVALLHQLLATLDKDAAAQTPGGPAATLQVHPLERVNTFEFKAPLSRQDSASAPDTPCARHPASEVSKETQAFLAPGYLTSLRSPVPGTVAAEQQQQPRSLSRSRSPSPSPSPLKPSPRRYSMPDALSTASLASTPAGRRAPCRNDSFLSTPGSVTSVASSRRASRAGESRTTDFSEFYDYHLMGSPSLQRSVPPSPPPSPPPRPGNLTPRRPLPPPPRRRTDSLSNWVEDSLATVGCEERADGTGSPSPFSDANSGHLSHIAGMTDANLSAITTQLELEPTWRKLQVAAPGSDLPSRPVTPPQDDEAASLPPGTSMSPQVDPAVLERTPSSGVKCTVMKMEQAAQDQHRMSETLRHWLKREPSEQPGTDRYEEYFGGGTRSRSRTPTRRSTMADSDIISCASTPNKLRPHGLDSVPWTPQSIQRRRSSTSALSMPTGSMLSGRTPASAATGTPQDVIASSRRRQSRTPRVLAKNEEVMEASIPMLVDSALHAGAMSTRLESLLVLAKICWPPELEPAELDCCDDASKRFVARCDLLASTGKLPALVQLLALEDEDEDDMRVAACRTITGAATSEIACELVIEAGAPELLVNMLCTSCNLDLLEAAVVALLQVVGCNDERLFICSANLDLIRVLIDLMEAAKDHLGEPTWESTAAAAAWLLHGLSSVGIEMGITMASEAGIEPAVALMEGDTQELRMACVSLLGSLVDNCDGNGVRAVRAHALPPLLRMLKQSEEDTLLAHSAASVIFSLVHAEGGRLHVALAGGTEAFVDLLRASPKSVEGWQGLAELLETPLGCQELLRLPDALPFVLWEADGVARALHSGDADVHLPDEAPTVGGAGSEMECAGLMARALSCLTSSEQAMPKVVAAGGVPVLVELLGGTSRMCLEQASRALWNVVHLPAGKAAVAASPAAVPRLLRAAQTGPAAARLCATKAITMLALEDALRVQVWEAGGAFVLLTMVEAGMTVELVEAAAAGLRTLALSAPLRHDILRMGGLGALEAARAAYPWDAELGAVLQSAQWQLLASGAGAVPDAHSQREALWA